MGDAWRPYKLGEIAKDIAMGPFGSNLKVDNFIESGVPVIRGQNLNVNGFNNSDFVFVSEEKANSMKRCLAYPGDLVFTHRGTLGQVGIIPRGKYPYYLVSQSQMRLSVNPIYLNPKFLYYFFKSPLGQRELLKNSSQVGVPAIANPTKSLKDVNIQIPSLETQSRISAILTSLDDKIELNLQMNRNLEAIAQAIFKEWFEDLRFPGFDGELVDGLPAGWNLGTLGDIITFKNGKTCPERDENGDYPIYGANGIIGFSHSFNAEPNVTVIGRVGSFCGSTYFSQQRSWITDNAIIASTKTVSSIFSFLRLKRYNLNSYKGGSGQPLVNQEVLSGLQTLIPDESILKLFEDSILPIYKKIKLNEKQNLTLIHLRDNLLPGLMQGKLKVIDT